MFFIFIIGGLCGRVQGDGKFFVEKVPPNIPYQRAFLLFYGGSEILVLQSKYEFLESDAADDLGWIVPVPAVPKIASADAVLTSHCFLKASLRSQPELISISDFICPIAVIFFFGCVGFLFVLCIEYPFLKKTDLSKAAWRRRLIKGLIITSIALFLMTSTIPHLGSDVDVEIVKAEKAGIYDVKVIRSQSAEAILDWLRENGFVFSETDKQVFEEYIGREWCFVVAKVEPEPQTEKQKIVSEGMVAPLILKFETEKAVYPLALTSTVGTETEILLYTLSESKLDCGDRLTLRHARKKQSTYSILYLLSENESKAKYLFADIPKHMFLCKFKKKLKPQEMNRDLEFEFAPDNEPYKETKLVW
jgi:hypothetical protein